MRFVRLDIHGFGRLRGRIDLECGEGRLGLVLENNESGKSTLSAALLAALYGIDGDRRRFRGTITDRDRYRPWKGGPYGLTLTLVHSGQEYVVERDFERDTVRVVSGGHDVTDRFRRGGHVEVGLAFTGLRKEQFTASCFVGQGDVEWSDAAGLTEALQRVADSQSGRATVARAVQALDQALERYDGLTLQGQGRVDTEIKRCEQRLEELRGAWKKLEAEHAEIDRRVGIGEQTETAESWTEIERAALRIRRARQELAATESLLADDTALRTRIETIEKRLSQDTHLDAITDAVREGVEKMQRDLQTAGAAVRQRHEDIRQVELQIEDRREQLAELAVVRIPTDEEVAELGAALSRFEDAETQVRRWNAELENEKTSIEATGTDTRQALALARDFEELGESQRLRIAQRGSIQVQFDEERTNIESELSNARQDLDRITRAQDSRRHRGFAMAVIGVILAAVGFAAPTWFSALTVDWPVLVAPGAVLALFGAVVAGRAMGHRADEEERARQTVAGAADRIQQLDARVAEEELGWTELATSIGVDAAVLEGRYRDWTRVEHRVRSLSVLRARVEEAAQEFARARQHLDRFDDLFDEMDGPVPLDQRVPRAWSARDLDRSLRELGERLRELLEKRRELESRLQEGQNQLLATLAYAGFETDDPTVLDPLLEQFSSSSDEARERDELRRVTLPGLNERRLAPLRRAELERAHDKMRAELPGLEARVRQRAETEGARGQALVESLRTPLGQIEFEQRMRELEAHMEGERERQQRDRAEVRVFLERYGDQSQEIRAQIQSHEQALRRAAEFRDAVNLARDTLVSLGQETHRVWAAQLDRFTNQWLRAMGSEVEDVRFDESLSVQLRQRGKVITDGEITRVLSAGAAEAVFLAARLAVSRVLGGDERPLPLILDDPLANADDDRMLDTLRLLLDAVVGRQQVLLMACQQSRYDWARETLGRKDTIAVLRLDAGRRVGPAEDAAS